ncbi:MAG: MoxR family ATPase [Planctomycetales bacterium]|nr:MoxR family ATPase [Planctomycetales bacterium]
MTNVAENMQRQADEFRTRYTAVREEIGKTIVGHDEIVHGVLTCLFVGGHCLLEGVPGLGKTMLVRTLSEALSLHFSRIQFTPDLMPADILGTNMIVENEQGRKAFEFQKGPIFTQICLADEINRATPKTQSALLETMQEGTITVAGQRYQLDKPFLVLATQNPIEQEGTYPLPEAQLDRFAMKLEIGYPDRAAQLSILKLKTRSSSDGVATSLSVDDLAHAQRRVSEILVAESVQHYIISLCEQSRQHAQVVLGVSPRGMLLWQEVAKAWALLHDRDFVIPDDIQAVAAPVLGVRLVVRNANTTDVIHSILEAVDVPSYR